MKYFLILTSIFFYSCSTTLQSQKNEEAFGDSNRKFIILANKAKIQKNPEGLLNLILTNTQESIVMKKDNDLHLVNTVKLFKDWHSPQSPLRKPISAELVLKNNHKVEMLILNPIYSQRSKTLEMIIELKEDYSKRFGKNDFAIKALRIHF